MQDRTGTGARLRMKVSLVVLGCHYSTLNSYFSFWKRAFYFQFIVNIGIHLRPIHISIEGSFLSPDFIFFLETVGSSLLT